MIRESGSMTSAVEPCGQRNTAGHLNVIVARLAENDKAAER
jgi:hypothetical protein